MLRFAVLVSGGGTDLQSIIDAWKAGKINGELALVVSNRKQAYGLERARLANIPAVCIHKQENLLKRLKKENIDFVVLAGYLAILSKEVIEAYPNKIINIHPSLIPSFCGDGMYGMHVHNAVFAKGAKVSGATVHFVSEEVDGGPIIAQRAVPIDDLNTPEEIQARVLEIEHQILPEVVAKYCDGKVEINEEGRVIVK